MVKVNSRTIQRLLQGHGQFIRAADEARRYYSNVNRIKQDNSVLQRQAETEQALGNPLHLADNRISHSWHNLLVTQKVSYALSYPPVFDVGNKTANERIAEILGDQYTATAMQLGIDASNTSVGWLHYWRGTDGRFRYHTVDPEQIVPMFSGTLESDLVGVLRCYTMLDPQSGQTVQVCEYWDDTTCRFYKQNGVSGNYTYFEYPEVGQELRHGLGAVPFIPFYNNADRRGDLPLYRDLIDAYDKVVSGFANDMEDVQEVIFVIKNYGGTDKTDGIPPLKASFEAVLESSIDYEDGNSEFSSFSPDDAQMLRLQVYGASKLAHTDPALLDILNREFTAFLEGGSTAQECAGQIQSRVSLYLAENAD